MQAGGGLEFVHPWSRGTGYFVRSHELSPSKMPFFGYFETTILEGTRFLTPLRGGAELFSPYVREALIFYLMVGGS